MNILFVSTDAIPHTGGKSTHILDLCDGLNYLGHETKVISALDFPSILFWGYTLPLLPLKMVNQSLFEDYSKYFYEIIQSRIIKKAVDRHDIDVVSVQDVFAAKLVYKSLKRLEIPIFLTMHTYFAVEPTLDKNRVFDDEEVKYMFENEIRALDCVKAVIAVDSRIKEHVSNASIEYLKNRDFSVYTIPNFTNIEKFVSVSLVIKNNLRMKYGVHSDSFIIICSRRLVEKNGVLFAIKAMSLIPNESKAHLLVIGDGPQKDRIEELIACHNLCNRVTLLGSIKNEIMNEYYQLSDISVVPSITVNGLQEATSVSAIESMSCGVPVIASNIGGLTEIIRDSHNGFLVSEGSPVEIKDRILLLEKDQELLQKLSQNAQSYIRTNHSNITAAAEYLRVFSNTKEKQHD